jgi:hypothetical protein
LRIPRTIFMVLLGLNGVFALLLGLNSLANFKGGLASFGILYNETMDPLGTISGFQFLLQAAMLLMAIAWTRHRNSAGPFTGVAVGLYLVGLTVVELAYGRGQIALVADLPRGALLVIFGALAWRPVAGG